MNANRLLSEKSVVSFRHRVNFLTEMIGQMPLSEVGPLRRGFELLDEAKEELLVAENDRLSNDEIDRLYSISDELVAWSPNLEAEE